jgi:phosphoribosylanthranilate isomerase
MDIKICGLTNLEDAACAVDAGADYLGFVRYAGSPRGVTIAELASLRASLGGGVRMVAVMVNPSYAEASAAVEQGGVDIIQIHGAAPYGCFDGFPYPLWRALAVSAAAIVPDPSEWPAERYIVDAHVPGQYGGTGIRADWDEAQRLARIYPVMLAGGLTPSVVAEAIGVVRPLGVDVSSGIEMRPGRKDHEALRAFISAARVVCA